MEWARELHQRYPQDRAAPHGIWNILRTGEAEIVPEIAEDTLAANVPHEELRRILRQLGLRSYIGVPLAVRGNVLGVITFLSAESGRRYAAADLVVVPARTEADRAVKVYILAIAVLLTVLVGASRVYLGVHWPTDVLAGWALGGLWALVCLMVMLWLQSRGQVEGG